MAKNIQFNVGSVLTKIEFTDDDGIVLGFLKINLTDIRLVKKLEDISRFFMEYRYEGEPEMYMSELDTVLTEKFSFLLGYDCRNTLFGVLSPTTLMGSGDMFAHEIIGRISETFSAKIQEVAAARAAAMAKHTAKYERV